MVLCVLRGNLDPRESRNIFRVSRITQRARLLPRRQLDARLSHRDLRKRVRVVAQVCFNFRAVVLDQIAQQPRYRFGDENVLVRASICRCSQTQDAPASASAESRTGLVSSTRLARRLWTFALLDSAMSARFHSAPVRQQFVGGKVGLADAIHFRPALCARQPSVKRTRRERFSQARQVAEQRTDERELVMRFAHATANRANADNRRASGLGASAIHARTISPTTAALSA